MPFHSRGRGSTSEGATPTYITDSRSSTLGLSNEMLFHFWILLIRCLKKVKCLTENQLYGITWPPVYIVPNICYERRLKYQKFRNIFLLESTKCELAILCSDSDNEVQGPEVKILSWRNRKHDFLSIHQSIGTWDQSENRAAFSHYTKCRCICRTYTL